MKTLLIVIASTLAVWITVCPVSAQTEKGAQVYAAQKCSMCHSIAGKGNAKGPLDDVGSKFTSDQIHEWIVDPAGMFRWVNRWPNPSSCTSRWIARNGFAR